MSTSIIFQIQSSIIILILCIGLYFRKDRKKHPKIMTTAVIWDVLLILQIELSRGAIDQAMEVQKQSQILSVHILLAVSTVLLYFALIFTGRKILKGQGKLMAKHRLMGRAAFILRILTYITSFWVLK